MDLVKKRKEERLPASKATDKQERKTEVGEKESLVTIKSAVDEGSQQDNLEGATTTNFEEKYNSLKDKFLRLSADFENYKKHSQKEKEQARVAGVRELASSFFEIMDSLELALRHGSEPEVESITLVRGVQLTYEQFVSQLKNFGIVQISAEIGEKFNPVFHQAIENTASESIDAGHIVQEIAKGYASGKKLIRPVTVTVSSGPEKKQKPEE